MSRIKWDAEGERLYETGVKNGVLFVKNGKTYKTGVPWNGLTAVTESPSGAEASPLYADDIKYLNLVSLEEFGGTIEAYTYPDEFAECDGSAAIVDGVYVGQQKRSEFAVCYKTTVGNDSDGTDYGYKLHIVYGCLASPSEKAYNSINDSPEAMTFSWEFTTTPVEVADLKPTSCVIIDSTKVDKTKLKALEDKLFGTDGDGDTGTEPTLVLPDTIKTMMAAG
jgi:hypothetical protein